MLIEKVSFRYRAAQRYYVLLLVLLDGTNGEKVYGLVRRVEDQGHRARVLTLQITLTDLKNIIT